MKFLLICFFVSSGVFTNIIALISKWHFRYVEGQNPCPKFKLCIKIVWQAATASLEKGTKETGNERKSKMSLEKKK